MTSYLATIVIDHLVSKYAQGLNEQLLKTSEGRVATTRRLQPRIKLNYNIYTVEPPRTATSPNGYLSTTATSPQRLPIYNGGYLSTTATALQRATATSPQRLPLYNGYLSTTATNLQRRLPLHNGYRSTTGNGYLSTTATNLQRRLPLHNGYRSTTGNGYLSTTATSLQRRSKPCLNLSTTTNCFCPGGQSIHWLLFKPGSTTATMLIANNASRTRFVMLTTHFDSKHVCVCVCVC